MFRRLGLATVCVMLAVGALACGSRSGEPDVAFTVPARAGATLPGVPTSPPPAESAKGKPCVAANGVEAKPGKPEVKMPEGVPPAQLVSTDLKVGTGNEVKLGDKIKVQYVGIACSNGKQFDSSWDRGEAASFDLVEGGLIKGWTQGIPGMKVGGQRQLTIPSDLAYGPAGQPPDIAPDEALVFVIDMIEDNGPAPASSLPGAVPPTPPTS